MKKFVPYEKLSKKEKRRLDNLKRGTWNEMSPVTRVSKNEKIYNRKRTGKYDDGYTSLSFIFS